MAKRQGSDKSSSRRKRSTETPKALPVAPDRYATATFFDPVAFREERERRLREAEASEREEPQPYADPALSQPPQFPGPVIVNGLCDECGETVSGEQVHKWWCSWWDTEEGKQRCPF